MLVFWSYEIRFLKKGTNQIREKTHAEYHRSSIGKFKGIQVLLRHSSRPDNDNPAGYIAPKTLSVHSLSVNDRIKHMQKSVLELFAQWPWQ